LTPDTGSGLQHDGPFFIRFVEFERIVSAVVLIIVIVVLIVVEVLFQLLVLKVALPIFENRPPIGAELFPPQPAAEAVTIVTKDGVSLAGNLLSTPHASPRGVILFCHEMDSNRWSAAFYCEGLLSAGFHVLTIDFRNQGDSQSFPGYHPLHWPSVLEVEDACAAVAFINQRSDLCRLPLGIFGISRGASIALVAAGQCDSIQRVVSDGAYCCNELLLLFTNRWGRLYFPELLLRWLPKWHVQISLRLIKRVSEFRRGFKYANVERSLSQLRHKRLLMISGERDTYVSPEVTKNMHARTGQDDSTVWIVPGAKHNMSRQAAPLEYDRRLVEFFSNCEPPSGDLPEVCSANGSHAAGAKGNGRAVLVRGHSSSFSSD
jgi:pimeloyl-ACP methyl ester carboxylesterase